MMLSTLFVSALLAGPVPPVVGSVKPSAPNGNNCCNYRDWNAEEHGRSGLTEADDHRFAWRCGEGWLFCHLKGNQNSSDEQRRDAYQQGNIEHSEILSPDAVGSLGRVGNPFEVPVGMRGEGQMVGSYPVWVTPDLLGPAGPFSSHALASGDVALKLSRSSGLLSRCFLQVSRLTLCSELTAHGQLFCPRFRSQRFNINAASAADESNTSRVDLALGVVSLSAAMIATGLTASCLAAKTCRELVPITRWAFDRGPVWGVTGRAAVNGLIHYAVARWVPKGKWRTTTLAVLAAINVTNAVLDIRTLTKIEKDAGRGNHAR